ncbi:hypothetical protein VNO78_18340 [Psophocarpus tetragonolobus]|uniref:Uncharacterized protein n=1 Tax=Psophocarpus tetragonolobus TaxID=3891 RepID=A0AAN9SI69_PSOTE
MLLDWLACYDRLYTLAGLGIHLSGSHVGSLMDNWSPLLSLPWRGINKIVSSWENRVLEEILVPCHLK